MNAEKQGATVLAHTTQATIRSHSAEPAVPELVPDAPIREPEPEPHTPAAPPEREPDLDPFNPDWPEHRPEPRPKA
jgi:hypothetical protein